MELLMKKVEMKVWQVLIALLMISYLLLILGCSWVPTYWVTSDDEKLIIERFRVEFEVLRDKIKTSKKEKIDKKFVIRILNAGVKGSKAIEKIMIGEIPEK